MKIPKQKRKSKTTWIQQIDKRAFTIRIPDFFHLSCCDCGLRHQVFIEKVGKNKLRMGMVRDDYATRKFKQLKKNVKPKNKIK